MAFMVPLVKNHYDIYARNNPADHNNSIPTPRRPDNSLYLSATSLGKNGAHPVTKQYRIVISGGKVVGNKKQQQQNPTGATKSQGPKLSQASNGKLYYRLPSASITLPVRTNSAPAKVPVKPKKPEVEQPSSPTSVSPPSRPLPHVRRTVRNPLTNRVYSYSVSIPDYVAEEDEEEELDDEEDEDHDFDDDDDDDLDLELDLEDKENRDLLLFSTSAPAGTGPIVSSTPSPPPAKTNKKPKKSQLQTESLPASPDTAPPNRHPHQRTLSSTSTTSTTSTTNSREYVELLRKFILHLKMLKIGGKRRSKSTTTTTNNNNPDPEPSDKNAQLIRPRKRKDTMEDSNRL